MTSSTTTKSLQYHYSSEVHRAKLLESVAWKDRDGRSVRIEVGTEKDRSDAKRVEHESADMSAFSFSGFNTGNRRSLLIIDIDNQYSHDSVSDLELRPNWIGLNRNNGHAQLTYILDSAVYFNKSFGSSKSSRLAKMTQQGLSLALGGDPFFSNTWARNHLADSSASDYDFHFQHPLTPDLSELFGSLDEDAIEAQAELFRRGRRGPKENLLLTNTENDGTLMRKMFLFDQLRTSAYPLRTQLERHLRYSDLAPHAESMNREYAETHYRGQLDESVVKATINSILRFCNSPTFGKYGRSWFTTAQQSKGGKSGGVTQGKNNVENGTLADARNQNSANASERRGLIRMHHLDGLSPQQIAAEMDMTGTRRVTDILKSEGLWEFKRKRASA